VLGHRGLLTSVEACRRAARRRPVTSRAHRPARAAEGGGDARRDRRPSVRPVVTGALALVAAAAAGGAIARWFGVRPPLARW
jgi:hypothetical protein